jgi:nucleotide-binding universal stress UspA family protein
MKILLAIDTSPDAGQTVDKVCRMFPPADTTVVVLSAVGENEPETIPSPVLMASVAQNLAVLAEDLVRAHQETAVRAVATLRGAGFTATAQVAFGDPRHVLVQAARTYGADMIVVGCHGHSAAHRLLVGSVASHLVHHAPCDLLVVRHPAT